MRLSCGADPRRAASIETTTKAAGAQTQFLPQSGTGSFKRWLTRAPSLPDRGTLRHKGRLKVSQPFTNGRTVKRRKGLELLQGKATSVKYRDAIEELRSIVNESGLKACPELGWEAAAPPRATPARWLESRRPSRSRYSWRLEPAGQRPGARRLAVMDCGER